MAERRQFIQKKTPEILDDLLQGYREAGYRGHVVAQKYLQSFREKYNSIPNAVKFFLFDFLAEESYHTGDIATCRDAAAQALGYLSEAQAETAAQLKEHLPQVHCFERGIALAVDEGRADEALELCERAITLGLGKVYEAKRASVRRLL